MSKGLNGAFQEGVEGSITLVGVPCPEWRIVVEGDRGYEGLETKLVEQDAFAGIVLGNVKQDQIRSPCFGRFTWFLSSKAVDDEGIKPLGIAGVVARRPRSSANDAAQGTPLCAFAVEGAGDFGTEFIWQSELANPDISSPRA